MKFNRKVWGRWAAALVLLVGSAASQAQQGVLNIICSAGTAFCESLARSYQRTTPAKVNMIAKSTGEALAQLIAERANPKTDLWYGGTGDPHLQAAEQGLLQDYRSAQIDQLHDWAVKQARVSGWQTVGVYLGPLGFSYNPEVLARKGQPVPACWADLLKPGYKGEIQMAHPNSSGTAYVVIASLVQIMGEEAAFAYLARLDPNISQYTRSGSAPMRNAARGENAIGLSFIADVVGEASTGLPIKWAVPCEGTGMEIGSMSLIKGARNTAEARKFYEWVLTPQVQDAAHLEAKSPQYPSHKAAKVHPDMPKLSELKLIDYDFARYGTSQVRRGLIARWERDIGNQRR